VCACVCVRVMLPFSDVRKQIMRQISVHHRDEITSDCRKCHNGDLLNLYCTLGDVGSELFKNVGNRLPTVIASRARRTRSLIKPL